MFSSVKGIPGHTPGFPLTHQLPYTQFVPKLYNLCTKKVGMRHGLIMPARGFCSDGTQGAPQLAMGKHFSTWPFDLGEIGGTIDFARMPAYVSHGQDLVIVQATHIGFDPQKKNYGTYPRHRTAERPEDMRYTHNCGMVNHVINPYLKAYQSAATHTEVSRMPNGNFVVRVRDYFLEHSSNRFSIRINFAKEKMFGQDGSSSSSRAKLVSTEPASRNFVASDEFASHLNKYEVFRNLKAEDESVSLGEALTIEWFNFECLSEAKGQFEKNIRPIMPWVVTNEEPMLAAAQACTQAEFHRFLNEIYFAKKTPADVAGRKLIMLSGLNIDVAPPASEMATGAFFPRTYFVPWAGYAQFVDESTGKRRNEIWDHEQVIEQLAQFSTDNDKQMQFDEEMRKRLDYHKKRDKATHNTEPATPA